MMAPDPMIDAMKPDCVQAGVAEENLQTRLGCRIPLQHCRNVFANCRYHSHFIPRGSGRFVIPSKPLLRSEGSGRAARNVALFRDVLIARLVRFPIKPAHLTRLLSPSLRTPSATRQTIRWSGSARQSPAELLRSASRYCPGVAPLSPRLQPPPRMKCRPAILPL